MTSYELSEVMECVGKTIATAKQDGEYGEITITFTDGSTMHISGGVDCTISIYTMEPQNVTIPSSHQWGDNPVQRTGNDHPTSDS